MKTIVNPISADSKKTTADKRIPATQRIKENSTIFQSEYAPPASQPYPVQATPNHGSAQDKYEREAENVAHHLADTHAQGPLPAISLLPQQVTPQQSSQSINSPVTSPVQPANLSGGFPLSNTQKGYYQSRFKSDFSEVKLHTDSSANLSAKALNAKAYTHGDNIVFDNGFYAPDTAEGQHLLAHELTHVVQQQGVKHTQKQAATIEKPILNFTEELIDLTDAMPSATASSPSSPTMDVPSTPQLVQRDAAVAAPPRKDIAFFMGKADTFQAVARAYFKQHHPQVEQVILKDSSLNGLFAHLRANVSVASPAGNIYIVSHANVDGTLSFGLDKKDKDKKTTFGEMKNALANNPDMFVLNGGIDAATKIQIKGCNIGRNDDMLNAIDESFGGAVEVDAPTHKQGYQKITKKVGKKTTVETSQYFNTYAMEYPGSVTKSDKELVEDFSIKYSDLNLSPQDWEIAVLGVKRHKTKTDADTKAEQKVVTDEMNAAIKGLDAKADDYKTEKKRLTDEATSQKKTISTAAKEKLKTLVATGSKGAIRKVHAPFNATVFDADSVPKTGKKILEKAPVWFKEIAKGYKFSKPAFSEKTEDGQNVIAYEVVGKKGDEEKIFSMNFPYPKTDEAIIEQAETSLENYKEKEKTFDISRRDSYEWRIEKKAVKPFETIKAKLEMTAYTIDLDFKEPTGDKVDPATKTGDDFYFGQSTVD